MTVQRHILRRRARRLRKEATFPERLLWSRLRKKQLGVRFHRQRPVREYIVDFLAPSVRLVIEIDGESHDDVSHDYDLFRQQLIESEGYTALRFTNDDVLQDLDAVFDQIRNWLNEQNSSLLKGGG